MFKVMAFLRRRPDLSREKFIDYYETHHAPLILQLMPGIRAYRRNYLLRSDLILGNAASPPDFDVVTEIYFDDRAAYEAGMRAFDDPEVMQRLVTDEQNFLDHERTSFIAVDERASQGDTHFAGGEAQSKK
jgi:uncharacterized protein (TIGR02118 family)